MELILALSLGCCGVAASAVTATFTMKLIFGALRQILPSS